MHKISSSVASAVWQRWRLSPVKHDWCNGEFTSIIQKFPVCRHSWWYSWYKTTMSGLAVN